MCLEETTEGWVVVDSIRVVAMRLFHVGAGH